MMLIPKTQELALKGAALFTTLVTFGFGIGLLCSDVPSHDGAGRPAGLVYLYKQGTFYPFAPTGPKTRDNLLEIQVRDARRPMGAFYEDVLLR